MAKRRKKTSARKVARKSARKSVRKTARKKVAKKSPKKAVKSHRKAVAVRGVRKMTARKRMAVEAEEAAQAAIDVGGGAFDAAFPHGKDGGIDD